MSEDFDGPEIPRSTYVTSLLMLQQRGFAARTFIDVGAAEGAFFLARLETDLFPGARHFFIDAMQENEAAYRKLAGKFGTGHEIAAVSCMEGRVNLRIDPDFYNTHIDYLQPGGKYASVREVPVTTLDQVVARHALEPPFALKLDVQGGEMDALRGALRTLQLATVVTTEIQIFSERDTLVELLGFMQGLGFALYDLSDLGYYPSDGTLYQCYATFIPKRMDFRRDIPWVPPGKEKTALALLRERRANNLQAIDELVSNT
jgi:FkbM family methyltransferase